MNKSNENLSSRTGATLFLFLVTFIFLLAIAALVIDIATIALARCELKRAADSAALAAANELLPPATPHFPLKSPIGLSLNLPDVLKVELQKSFDTSLQVGKTEIQVIDSSNLYPNPDLWRIAQKYAALNSFAGLSGFDVTCSDVIASKQPDAWSNLPLLPVNLAGLGPSIENLLLVADREAFDNSVTVTTRRDSSTNGSLPLFFRPLFGNVKSNLRQSSTATFYRGFGVRPGAKVLPIGMDITVWRTLRLGNGLVNGIPIAQSLLAGNGQPVILIDEQKWDPQSMEITSGSDGIWEVLLLNQPLDELNIPGLIEGLIPNIPIVNPKGLLAGPTIQNVQKTPSTIVSLNLSTNGTSVSTNTMLRQIRDGLSESDIGDRLDLPFKAYGHQAVHPSVIQELESIIGQPRILPLFETISGTAINKVRGLLGAKEPYRIVGFGGVVVTEVRDLGIIKLIKLQPASLMSPYVTPANPDRKPSFSDCVFTSAVLSE